MTKVLSVRKSLSSGDGGFGSENSRRDVGHAASSGAKIAPLRGNFDAEDVRRGWLARRELKTRPPLTRIVRLPLRRRSCGIKC